MLLSRILALSACLVTLAGCIDDDSVPQAVPSPEPEVVHLWDLPLPDYVVDANQIIGIPANATMAVIIRSDSDFYFFGDFSGPIALIPWQAWQAQACTELFGTIRSIDGAKGDSSSTDHPAGDYVLISFAATSNGLAYFSGYPTNKEETYVEWLAVDGAAHLDVVQEMGQTDGLSAVWNATLQGNTTSPSVVLARYSDESGLLDSGYYTKAGEPEVTLTVNDCEPVTQTDLPALPSLDHELMLPHAGGAMEARVEYERLFDEGEHRFSLVTIEFPPLTMAPARG